MHYTITFTEKTINETTDVINQLDNNLKNNLQSQDYAKAKGIIETTSKKTKAILVSRKRRKRNLIKYGKPNSQSTSETTRTKTKARAERPVNTNPIPEHSRGTVNTQPPIREFNNDQDRNARQRDLQEKELLIQNLRKELEEKQKANYVNRQIKDNFDIDAKIKEKEQIIQTLRYDLQQQTPLQQHSLQQNRVSPHTNQRQLYSEVVSNIFTPHDNHNIQEQQKNLTTAPVQNEGKKELITAFTKEMEFLNTGIKNLEKRFQILLNTL